jgi:predicted TPR repeat methyltransferase
MLTLAQSLIELRRTEEAAAVLERCLKVDPANQTARFLLAAATGADGTSVPAPPPGFTATLFDRYAHRFDTHLVADLAYRGPEQLREVVDRIQPQGQFDILDLGCGTGLVGLRFRDRARSLVGVDASEQMLRRASERGIYQRLEHGELLASLQAREAELDLILAGDVFIYVGELGEVFTAAHRALRPGGLFAFTVERHDAGDGFVVLPSRRYAHSRGYIESLAAGRGFAVLAADPIVLRVERGQEVAGIVFLLRRPMPTPATG